ncbi:TRAP transporter large permease [Ancylobacter vacuolatus]|uniref:TRAP transporter large permease protein n=1 Tax=Ancylobacter vacuolatus TaxID=223389 RepID=A0ABU0DNP4_9HYPH|nr:TRAP transporter large permease [Ancylobacter vacuolatus]MDQ0349840.1 tripartite ATP-independent transporter DctM subunit [Ancylobacter vacuolatus]
MALTFGLMALFLVLGAPLAVTFGLVIFLQMGSYGLSIAGLSNIPYEEISSYPLVAIPLFMLTGELMNRSGMAAELIALADLLLRRIRAAFGYITVAASAMMGAITGSSVATVAAVGGIVSPEMIRRGYPKGYVASLTASAGLLGVLVPPSIPLILYGATVGVSISQLFIATMVPALLMGALFLFVHNRLSRKVLRGGIEGRSEADGVLDPRKSPARIVFDATSALLLPVVILGGIYGGIMTPTEAAAIGCLYAIGVSVGRRLISREGFTRSFRAAAITGSGILIIIAMTGIFNRAMVLNQVPQDIAIWVATYIESPIAFLLMVNVVLLLVGTFMETNASILLMGPLLAPAAERFGIDPVHFGIVLATNLEIGLLTPPMAANLYVAARAANARLADMMPYLGWFFGAALLGQAIITFVPFATLWFRYL